MKINELNENELNELKIHYYGQEKFEESIDVSYEDMINIDNLVSNEELYDFYADTLFTKEDFFCNI